MRSTDGHLLPSRVGDAVETGDQVPRLEPSGGGGGVIGDKVDIGRLRAEGFHLVVHHVKAGHQQQRQQKV